MADHRHAWVKEWPEPAQQVYYSFSFLNQNTTGSGSSTEAFGQEKSRRMRAVMEKLWRLGDL